MACVKFEYQTANWAFDIPGLVGGLVVLAIIATVLVFRIFNAVQDACISHGREQAPADLLRDASSFDLPIARTIADLDRSEAVRPGHLNEAINYRMLDRQLWT